jgi:hypothetical protein
MYALHVCESLKSGAVERLLSTKCRRANFPLSTIIGSNQTLRFGAKNDVLVRFRSVSNTPNDQNAN